MAGKWNETPEAVAFVASGESRETSREIMEAIAFFARDLEEAEGLWNGDGFGDICGITDFWEHVTGNGLRDPEDFLWGASGRDWCRQLMGRGRFYTAAAAGGETWHIYGPRGFLGAVEVPGDDLEDVLAAAQAAGLVPARVTALVEG